MPLGDYGLYNSGPVQGDPLGTNFFVPREGYQRPSPLRNSNTLRATFLANSQVGRARSLDRRFREVNVIVLSVLRRLQVRQIVTGTHARHNRIRPRLVLLTNRQMRAMTPGLTIFFPSLSHHLNITRAQAFLRTRRQLTVSRPALISRQGQRFKWYQDGHLMTLFSLSNEGR